MTHSTAMRNALANLVVDALDAGSGGANGTLEILETDNTTVLATLDLANPAFGAAVNGVATANAIASATVSATGTAAKCKFKDRDGTVVFSGTVTATGGGGDIELSSLGLTSGDGVAISSATYTAAS